MVKMKRLNPTHNQVEPLYASIEKVKIAFAFGWSKQAWITRLAGAGHMSRTALKDLALLLFAAPAPLTLVPAPSTGCSLSSLSHTIRSF